MAKTYVLKLGDYLNEVLSKLNIHVSNSLSKIHICGEMIHQHLLPTHVPNIVWSLICSLQYFPQFSWVLNCKVWTFHMVTSSYPPCQHAKKKAPPLGSNLVLYTIVCTTSLQHWHHACKTKIVEPSCVLSNDELHSEDMVSWMLWSLAPPQSYLGWQKRYPNSCKISSRACGVVGKSSSCNFMLHHPKDISISSCVWPTN